MTGFGYMVFVSGLEIEDAACFCDADVKDIEAWCKGEKEIPADKLAIITERCAVDDDLLKRPAVTLNMYEECRLFTAGVMIGTLLKKDIVRI
ncbi:MAG: hypothetical protein E7235_04375 [Lachnospiraceae bacterium]|nr:hypothetical protein [Lachnospiraceae bacterium]